VGKKFKPHTNIGIPKNARVSLEVNTVDQTLDFFIDDKHFEQRVVNVPKDVYFGVWLIFFSVYLYLLIHVFILMMWY
jgi:hypothetical protein